MGGDRIEYDHPPHSQGLSIQKLAKFVTIYSPTKSYIEDRPINWNLRNWAKEYLSAITRIYFSLVDCPNNINKYSNIEGCL